MYGGTYCTHRQLYPVPSALVALCCCVGWPGAAGWSWSGARWLTGCGQVRPVYSAKTAEVIRAELVVFLATIHKYGRPMLNSRSLQKSINQGETIAMHSDTLRLLEDMDTNTLTSIPSLCQPLTDLLLQSWISQGMGCLQNRWFPHKDCAPCPTRR